MNAATRPVTSDIARQFFWCWLVASLLNHGESGLSMSACVQVDAMDQRCQPVCGDESSQAERERRTTMGCVQKNMLSQKMCTDISSHCTVPRTPGTGLALMAAAFPAAVTRSARERRQRNAFRESDSPLYL